MVSMGFLYVSLRTKLFPAKLQAFDSQVVKLQGPRWASVAAQEWAHGAHGNHRKSLGYGDIMVTPW